MLTTNDRHFPAVSSPRKGELLFLVNPKDSTFKLNPLRSVKDCSSDGSGPNNNSSLAAYFSQPTPTQTGAEPTIHQMSNNNGKMCGFKQFPRNPNRQNPNRVNKMSSPNRHTLTNQETEPECVIQRSLTYGNQAVIMKSARNNTPILHHSADKNHPTTSVYLPPAVLVKHSQANHSMHNQLPIPQLEAPTIKITDEPSGYNNNSNQRSFKKQLRKNMNLLILKKAKKRSLDNHTNTVIMQNNSGGYNNITQSRRFESPQRDSRSTYYNRARAANSTTGYSSSLYGAGGLSTSFSKKISQQQNYNISEIRKRIEEEFHLQTYVRYQSGDSPLKSTYGRASPETSNNNRVILNSMNESLYDRVKKPQTKQSSYYKRYADTTVEELLQDENRKVMHIESRFLQRLRNSTAVNSNETKYSFDEETSSPTILKSTLRNQKGQSRRSRLKLRPHLSDLGGFQLTGWQQEEPELY